MPLPVFMQLSEIFVTFAATIHNAKRSQAMEPLSITIPKEERLIAASHVSPNFALFVPLLFIDIDY
jgi:hypothetical protein